MDTHQTAKLGVTCSVVVLAAFAPLSPAFGQADGDSPPRYSSITILGSAAVGIGASSITDLWKPSTAVGLAIESPFTAGLFGISYQRIPFRGDGTSLPDFRAHALSTTWGLELPLQHWVRFHGGVSAGGWIMSFSGPRAGEENTVEIEAAAGLHGRVSLCVPGTPGCVFGSVNIARVLTEPIITNKSAAFGISITAQSPGWISSLFDGRPRRQRSPATEEVPAGRHQDSADSTDDRDMRGATTNRTQSSTFGRTIVTADEIRRAGLNRLGEILSLVDSWSTTTVDYFSWWTTPRGRAGPMDASHLVMVDNQWVEMGPGANWTIDRIGLSLGQIDSVEVLDAPNLVAGRFTSSGMIRFHTRRASAETTLQVHGMLANPAGDPGPHRYRTGSAQNVDKAGHDAGVRLLTGDLDWGVSTGMVLRSHYASDNRIYPRTRSVSDSVWPILELAAPSMLVQIGKDNTHSIQLLSSRFDDYRFIPNEMREVPLRQDWIHAGINGTVWNGKASSLRYRGGTDINWLDTYPNELEIDEHRVTTSHRVDVELHANSTNPTAGSFGLGIDIDAAPNDSLSHNETSIRFRAYGEKGWCLSTETCMSLQALGSIEDKGAGGHVRGMVKWSGAGGLWTSGSLTLERAPQSFNANVLRMNHTPAMHSGLSADAEFGAHFGRGWKAAGELFLRGDAPGRVLHDATGMVLTSLVPVLDSALVDEDPLGWFGGAGFTIRWQSATAGIHGSYTLQENLQTTPGMERRWALVPKHTYRQSFWLGIGDELTARLSAECRSGLLFPQLVAEEEQTRALSTSSVLLLEMALVKWFWERRFRGTVRVRDFTNRQQPAHPLGAAPGLTLFIQGDVVLSTSSAWNQ